MCWSKYFSCKAVDKSVEGCEPVSGHSDGIPVTSIKLDIDSDGEVEKMHSLLHVTRVATFTKFGKRLHKFQYLKWFRFHRTSRFDFFHYADQ